MRLWGPLPVFDALVHAFKICAVLWKNGPEETHGHSRWRHWDQRLDQLIPKTSHREDPKRPVNLWADHHAPQPLMAPTTFPEHRVGSIDGASPGPPVRALRKRHQAARYFTGKRHAANTLIYHQHPGGPVIETYYPRPGPYARQRMRLAAENAT